MLMNSASACFVLALSTCRMISRRQATGLIPFLALSPPLAAQIPLLPPDILANAATLQVPARMQGLPCCTDASSQDRSRIWSRAASSDCPVL